MFNGFVNTCYLSNTDKISEVLTMVKMSTAVFCVMMYTLVHGYEHSGEMYHLHLQG